MLLLRLSSSIISDQKAHRIIKGENSSRMSDWKLMTSLSLITGIYYICIISFFVTLCIKHFISLILQGMPNHLPKIVLVLSSETYFENWKHRIKNHTGWRFCSSDGWERLVDQWNYSRYLWLMIIALRLHQILLIYTDIFIAVLPVGAFLF